jgi:hypothetical protein
MEKRSKIECPRTRTIAPGLSCVIGNLKLHIDVYQASEQVKATAMVTAKAVCKPLKKLEQIRDDSTCQGKLSQFCFGRRYVPCEHVNRSGR